MCIVAPSKTRAARSSRGAGGSPPRARPASDSRTSDSRADGRTLIPEPPVRCRVRAASWHAPVYGGRPRDGPRGRGRGRRALEYNRRALMGMLAERTREATLVCLLFVLLTLVLAAPLSLSPATQALPLSADTRLFLWTISWDVEALLHHPLSLFDANIFFPEPRTLAYSEHILGSAVLGAPALLATGNPVLALNVIVLLSCVLCGLGAYVLARELGASVPAALVAGVVFAFGPPRFVRLAQVHLATVQWIPFGLAFLHRYARGARRADLLAAVAFFTLQALTSGHGGLFMALALGALVLYLWALGRLPGVRRVLGDLGRRRGAPPRRQRDLPRPLPAGAARRGAAPHARRRLRLGPQRRELPRRPHPRPAVAAVARSRPAREGGGGEGLSLPRVDHPGPRRGRGLRARPGGGRPGDDGGHAIALAAVAQGPRRGARPRRRGGAHDPRVGRHRLEDRLAEPDRADRRPGLRAPRRPGRGPTPPGAAAALRLRTGVAAGPGRVPPNGRGPRGPRRRLLRRPRASLALGLPRPRLRPLHDALPAPARLRPHPRALAALRPHPAGPRRARGEGPRPADRAPRGTAPGRRGRGRGRAAHRRARRVPARDATLRPGPARHRPRARGAAAAVHGRGAPGGRPRERHAVGSPALALHAPLDGPLAADGERLQRDHPAAPRAALPDPDRLPRHGQPPRAGGPRRALRRRPPRVLHRRRSGRASWSGPRPSRTVSAWRRRRATAGSTLSSRARPRP